MDKNKADEAMTISKVRTHAYADKGPIQNPKILAFPSARILPYFRPHGDRTSDFWLFPSAFRDRTSVSIRPLRSPPASRASGFWQTQGVFQPESLSAWVFQLKSGLSSIFRLYISFFAPKYRVD